MTKGSSQEYYLNVPVNFYVLQLQSNTIENTPETFFSRDFESYKFSIKIFNYM